MSKRAEIRARRRRDTLMQWLVPGIIVLVGLAILGGIVYYNVRASFKEVVVPAVVERPNKVDNATGDPNAPVTVTAFEDYQCPYCGIYSQQQEPKIIEKYVTTGKVYYKFVSFSFLGAESTAAAEASYCAMDQGKFWQYHDYLYANQEGENKGAFKTDRLEAFADRLGLDMSAFKSCLSSHKYAQKVKDDATYATQSGATGSPYFLVNKELVSVDKLEAAIDTALAGK